MNPAYADTLGYTDEELSLCFEDHIKLLTETLGFETPQLFEKLSLQNDGYRFSGKDLKVFNPFSILRVLYHPELKNYWFESATPSFLVNFLMEKRYDPVKIEDVKVGETIFSTFDLEDLKPEALLFQTAYITKKRWMKGSTRSGIRIMKSKPLFLNYCYMPMER